MAKFEEGNQAAAKGRTVEKLLERILIQEDHKRLRQGLEVLMDKVADGDQRALEFVTDRLDGKARQAIDLGGQEDNPLAFTRIERVIVKPTDKDS
jgi:hypothetical protein